MTFPKPVRYDVDTWLVMRTDPVLPKAVIQRVHGSDRTDRYLLFKWDVQPENRMLVGVHESLEKANSLVLYDDPRAEKPSAPTGPTHSFMSDAELQELATRGRHP